MSCIQIYPVPEVLKTSTNAHLLAFYFAGTGGFGNEIFCLRVNKHIFFYILETKYVFSDTDHRCFFLFVGLKKHIFFYNLVKKYVFSKYTVPEVFIIIYTVNSREAPLIALSYVFPNSHGL